MKNKYYAAIDIGSNSVRLLICQKTKNELTNRVKYSEMTRIGKDVDQTKVLNKDRMAATVKALCQYVTILSEYGITSCPVFATSAVRDARNKADFIERVKSETPFNVTVLSGDDEAHYGFLGVVKGSAVQAKKMLVIDVGGGSTEIIIGDRKGKIDFAHSFDIGAVRMTDRFKLKHSATVDDYLPIEQLLFKRFDAEKIASYLSEDMTCIAIGGTATNLAAIDLGLVSYDGAAVQAHQMSSDRLQALTKQLIAASRTEKLNITGLQVGRADIISAGAMIISSIMHYLGKDRLAFSDYDNLEGAVFMQAE